MSQSEEDKRASLESQIGKSRDMAGTAEEMPGHLIMQKVSARSYQEYIGRLKQGGSSGISEVFGQASEIFGGKLAEKTERLDLASFNEAPSELDRRARCLVTTIHEGCKSFLVKFAEQSSQLSRSSAGLSGGESAAGIDEAQALNTGTTAKFDVALKGLIGANLMLLAIEQSERGAAPPWYADFLGKAFGEADRLLPDPPLNQVIFIMSKGGTNTDPAGIARDAATALSNTVGAGAVGERGWSELHSALTGASKLRYSLLKNILEQPIETFGES